MSFFFFPPFNAATRSIGISCPSCRCICADCYFVVIHDDAARSFSLSLFFSLMLLIKTHCPPRHSGFSVMVYYGACVRTPIRACCFLIIIYHYVTPHHPPPPPHPVVACVGVFFLFRPSVMR